MYAAQNGGRRQDMEPAMYEKAKQLLLEKLENNRLNRQAVEYFTRGGKLNPRWHNIQEDLLPSSFFSAIVKTSQLKSFNIILEKLICNRKFGIGTVAKDQIMHERHALKTFEFSHHEHEIQDCGVFIDAELNFLCATPYKLYGNNHILTIKCPLKQYGRKFDEVINEIPFWKDEGKNLNIDNKWFIELQSELHITRRKFGFIMVWLGEFDGESQYRIVEIPRDDAFFENNVKPKLVYFYEEVMMKELVDSRMKRNMPLRE